jgi:hypothetical protein
MGSTSWILAQRTGNRRYVDYLISSSSWIISHHNFFKDRGWPGWFWRFFSYQNPILLGIAVVIDTLRVRFGGDTSNQRVIGRKSAD